jgi:Mce-associated membrane protein
MTLEKEDEKVAVPDVAAPATRGRTVSLRLSTVLTVLTVAALVVIACVLAWLLHTANTDLQTRDATAADNQRAEQIATDYAVGASTIDFKDFPTWLGKLKANTAPTLSNKFDATAPKLQEILTPLQWTSTATPIAAKVMSESGGLYQVDVFLNVTSTSAQTPQGGQTTVTYNITVDTNTDWKITDVGGMVGALPVK